MNQPIVQKNQGKQIISEISNRNAFFKLLEHNPGLVILKLGAAWCGPCQKIKDVVHAFFATSPDTVLCGDIDVDESFDFYSFLKSKKMVNGIPVILCYKKGNLNFIPDDHVTGADPSALDTFFKRCGVHLNEVKVRYALKIEYLMHKKMYQIVSNNYLKASR